MAAAGAVRRYLLFIFFWVLSGLAGITFASPTRLLASPSNDHSIFQVRGRPAVTINNASGSVVVFNSQTHQVIPQGAASDGGGSNFNALALFWIIFLYLVGGPLAVAGIRGWKCTIGAAIGLSSAVCSESHMLPHKIFSLLRCSSAWAAFINTIPSQEFQTLPSPGLCLVYSY